MGVVSTPVSQSHPVEHSSRRQDIFRPRQPAFGQEPEEATTAQDRVLQADAVALSYLAGVLPASGAACRLPQPRLRPVRAAGLRVSLLRRPATVVSRASQSPRLLQPLLHVLLGTASRDRVTSVASHDLTRSHVTATSKAAIGAVTLASLPRG